MEKYVSYEEVVWDIPVFSWFLLDPYVWMFLKYIYSHFQCHSPRSSFEYVTHLRIDEVWHMEFLY